MRCNMENLRKQLINEYQNRTAKAIESFLSDIALSSDLTHAEKYTLNRKVPYKANRIEQVKKRLTAHYDKQLNAQLVKLSNVSNAPSKMPNDLVLTINFYKNNTWGYCPRGNDNYGHSTDSITGCGYCKESTATAQLLNQNASILKRLYALKDSQVEKSNREALGYGAGYGILPSFEGGVGVNCHVRILENLGYKVTQSGNDLTTILIIREATND